MRGIGFVAPLALTACLGSMVRAPEQIPPSGVVECTDTLEVPIATMVGAVASAVTVAYGMTHMEWAVEHGGIFWLPVLGGFSFDLLLSGGLGFSRAAECRDAKQRGAELAQLNDARAKARAEAGVLWKRAATAARTDDCGAVRELDPEVRELDAEFYAVVFARDVAIARCLTARQ